MPMPATTTITRATSMITTMIRGALLAGLAALATPALAQTVEECDWRASLVAIPEPWDVHTRTFARGDIRITVTDAIEPAAGPYHLVVLSGPYDELGSRQCRVVSLQGSLGFARMIPASAQSAYDPATGLTLTIPAGTYDADTGGIDERDIIVTINQASGLVTARWAGGK